MLSEAAGFDSNRPGIYPLAEPTLACSRQFRRQVRLSNSRFGCSSRASGQRGRQGKTPHSRPTGGAAGSQPAVGFDSPASDRGCSGGFCPSASPDSPDLLGPPPLQRGTKPAAAAGAGLLKKEPILTGVPAHASGGSLAGPRPCFYRVEPCLLWWGRWPRMPILSQSTSSSTGSTEEDSPGLGSRGDLGFLFSLQPDPPAAVFVNHSSLPTAALRPFSPLADARLIASTMGKSLGCQKEQRGCLARVSGSGFRRAWLPLTLACSWVSVKPRFVEACFFGLQKEQRHHLARGSGSVPSRLSLPSRRDFLFLRSAGKVPRCIAPAFLATLAVLRSWVSLARSLRNEALRQVCAVRVPPHEP